MGAYLSTFAPVIPTYLYATLLSGVYATPKIWCGVKAVFTNTVPVDAYRGAGRPEAAYLLERIVDKAARETGIDPVELRRKNFIAPDAFPYQTPVALQYDSGNYHQSLDAALQLADYDGFAARRAESAKNGKLRGIGISTYVEACGIAPSAVVGTLGARAGLYEAATVRVNPTGSVSVFTGSHSHGQGHETTFAQIVADKLGIDFDQIEIVHGDTDRIPFGMGTYGSRSLAVGGEAICRALGKITEKAKRVAAHLLEADAADIDFAGGRFTVKGTDKAVAFGDVALQSYVPHNFPHKSAHDAADGLEPGLEEQAFYDPLNFTYPAGCHICEVEIDPETGATTIAKFTAVDDFGRVVNPMIVEGQVHGGIAQGIGQALLEQAVYDDSGQLLTGSLMDYAMPRADDLPFYARRHDRDLVRAQFARRQRMRRGGGHRLAARGRQRDIKRVGGKRRDRHFDAGDAFPCLARFAASRAINRRTPMRNFAYHKPATVAEAAALAAQGDARALAGGMTILPTMKQRLAAPSALVDLSAIAELSGIVEAGDALEIGATTRHAEVAASATVRAKIPALARLAESIGDPQVRNRGTIGGSAANNDPAADYPAAILGLGATVKTNKREIGRRSSFRRLVCDHARRGRDYHRLFAFRFRSGRGMRSFRNRRLAMRWWEFSSRKPSTARESR